LFAFTPSSNNKFSEGEISEFIGNLSNNEIIKQYYILENLKSKINNIFNENIEDNISKKEYVNTLKRYETIAKNYQANKSKIMDEYIKNYKVKFIFSLKSNFLIFILLIKDIKNKFILLIY
jgi:hypothetical protein